MLLYIMENDHKDLSVGVIMDGNRRWAKELGKNSFEGHQKGYLVFKDFLQWSKDLKIKTVYSYAFSEENWKRTESEVSFLISLIKKVVTEEADNFIKNKVRVIFAGNISKFPKDVYRSILDLQNKTKDNKDFNLVLCLSYSGRGEIVSAVNSFIKDNNGFEITEEDISKRIYSAGVSDPDIIIRTSGEQRLSGFLPWQSVYSEFFFIDKFWPDLNKEDLISILDQYKKRQRRMGK